MLYMHALTMLFIARSRLVVMGSFEGLECLNAWILCLYLPGSEVAIATRHFLFGYERNVSFAGVLGKYGRAYNFLPCGFTPIPFPGSMQTPLLAFELTIPS